MALLPRFIEFGVIQYDEVPSSYDADIIASLIFSVGLPSSLLIVSKVEPLIYVPIIDKFLPESVVPL